MSVWVALRMGVGITAVALMLLVMWGFRHSINPVRIFRTLPATGRLVAAHVLHLCLGGRVPAWAARAIEDEEIVRPSEGMRISVTLFHHKTLIRIGWWDVYSLGSQLVLTGTAVTTMRAVIVNTTLGCFAIVGSLFALWALHGTIPKGDRRFYNLFTAAFYPWARVHRESALRRAGEPLDDPLSQARHDLANMTTARNVLARHALEVGLDRSDPAQDRLWVMARLALGLPTD